MVEVEQVNHVRNNQRTPMTNSDTIPPSLDTTLHRPEDVGISNGVKKIALPAVVPVKLLSEELGLNASEIIKKLMESGVLATINESVDFETAAIIADEYGFTVEETQKKEVAESVDKIISKAELRPPVVTIMGHVDHGKTKLLDAIRETNIIDTESGGITQHIGAYKTTVKIKEGNKKVDREITFIDTPGHEAFSAMRAHGANITDIIILVVAADEGVKPQTVEAISHARAAKVPIVVAINKIDKPEADADRVKRELSEHKLIPEQWGGKTAMIPVSAKTGQGIDDLLETVVLTADIEDLKVPKKAPARGMVIESKVQPGKGPVATVVIQEGTLNSGDVIIYETEFAKVRFMEDWRGKRIKEAFPSDPVLVAGFKRTPKVGTIIKAVESEKSAKEITEKLEKEGSIKTIAKGISGLQGVSEEAKQKKIDELKIILRADTKGSLEAIKNGLDNIVSEDVKIVIISGSIGSVAESDINLAVASQGIVLAFRVPVPPAVRRLADEKKIKISKYDIIYQLIDDVFAALEGMLEPEIIETVVGKLEIIKVFLKEKERGIVGGKVTSGKITPGTKIEVMRANEKIGELKTESIKIGQEKVDQVSVNQEAGISYRGNLRLKPGDILSFVLVEEKLRTLKKKL